MIDSTGDLLKQYGSGIGEIVQDPYVSPSAVPFYDQNHDLFAVEKPLWPYDQSDEDIELDNVLAGSGLKLEIGIDSEIPEEVNELEDLQRKYEIILEHHKENGSNYKAGTIGGIVYFTEKRTSSTYNADDHEFVTPRDAGMLVIDAVMVFGKCVRFATEGSRTIIAEQRVAQREAYINAVGARHPSVMHAMGLI